MLAPHPDSNPLEALAAEFVERHRRGEAPSVEAYAVDHAELATQIRDLFPTIAALEKVRAGQEQPDDRRPVPAKLERLGDFRILREIGRGGMGIVYEAMQESLGRRVAVKVLARHSRLDDTHRRRFHREARTAGRLHHTNIVPILGVGEQEGLDYLVMQFIEGIGLDSVIFRMRSTSGVNPLTMRLSSYWRPDHGAGKMSAPTRQANSLSGLSGEAPAGEIAEEIVVTQVDFALSDTNPAPDSTPQSKTEAETGTNGATIVGGGTGSRVGVTQPLRQILRTYWQDVAFVGLQVAQALEYAHSQGTLHRDIKPGNLLVDDHGTTWVADFGLAKAMDQDAVSRTGEVLGTLLYMAPEQWRGTADARSDIYSLGVTLYELATLRVPLEVHDRMKSLGRSAPLSAVTAPRKICPSLPVDLETIILKAMAEEPAHRYQTAGELAADLGRFLQDQPISVRRPSLWERWWRWRRRNPAAAYFSTAAAALLILVVAVTSAAYVQTRVALSEASKANEARGEALASEKLERERAESMLTTSLATLDNVFNRLVPDQHDQGRALTVSGQDQGSQTAAASPESAALLEELLKVYDQLAAGQGTPSRLGVESARANRRIGDIHTRLGNLERAGTAYQQSIEKYRALAASETDRTLQLEIARLHNDLGAIYDRQRNREESRQEFQLALSILEPRSADPAPAAERFEAARTHFLLGRGTDKQTEPEPPHHKPRHGPGDGPRFGPEGPPDAEHRDGPPDGHGPPPGDEHRHRPGHRPPPGEGPPPENNDGGPPPGPDHGPPPEGDHGGPPPDEHGEGPGGHDHDRGHRPPPQRTDHKELGLAISLLDPLIKSDPKNPAYRYLLAQCYREEADPRATTSSELAKAEQLLTELVKEHPDVADYHFALADSYAMSDIRDLSPKEFPEAEKNLRAALSESTTLVDRNPYASDYAALHVHVLHKLAGILRQSPPERAGAPTTVDEIGRLYQEALRKQADLVKRFPESLAYLFWLGKIRMSLGEFWLERGNPEEAHKVFEAAIREVEPSYHSKVAQGPLGDVLRDLYDRLAESLKLQGRDQAAKTAQEKANKIGPPHPGPPGGDHFRPHGHRPGPPPHREDE
ncbi:MAG TPA: protein kinase [Planctomycetaceae bacterium]|jgi:serine/threonine protein kinase|nr:protein kinase [Planctomycetaceae bacterium]